MENRPRQLEQTIAAPVALLQLWLRLIRWKNLSIIFLTQFLAWWFVILPNRPAVLNFFNFILLSLSTILIAGSGYIINDYFDVKIDNINRPEKVVLGNGIRRKHAMFVHTVMNVVALFLCGFIAFNAKHIQWVLLQVGCTVLLWYYSTHFKRQFMSGNVIVALLTALTILVLVLYEPQLSHFAGNSSLTLCLYAYFAFVLNWMREIVKDMEDFAGDEAEGCVTMPIKMGLKFSARFVAYLSVAVIVPLLILAINTFNSLIGYYVIFLLLLPAIIWTVFFLREFTTAHFEKSSRWLKIIMLSGVLSFPLIYLQNLLTGRFY
jgi:4-hydroxybenzoate polyprenyltransferase